MNKANNTSENVMKMLSFILKKDKFTLHELVNYFYSQGIFYEQETILKYIRTLKKAGFVFEKTNLKTYRLAVVPIGLNTVEISTIQKIIKIINNDFPVKNAKTVEKLLRFSPPDVRSEILCSSDKKQISVRKKLEKYLKDNLRLEIFFKKSVNKQRKIVFELHDILVQDKNLFLKGYNITEKIPSIYNFADILSISQTPVMNKFMFGDKEAAIKFSPKISKSYNLKDGEQIIKKTKNSLIVKTNYYDEEKFFTRILRYVDGCIIVSPTHLREKFLRYIKNLYQMYDCNIYK